MKGSLCRLAETSFLWRDTAMRIRERFNPHAPFEARRRSLLQRSSCWANFNPRAPCGARPVAPRRRACGRYFNPRAPCGARPAAAPRLRRIYVISTHAPLAGRDGWGHFASLMRRYFNPRAPCGARPCRRRNRACLCNFNPRAPCGARLCGAFPCIAISTHFNPRAPCGARPLLDALRVSSE